MRTIRRMRAVKPMSVLMNMLMRIARMTTMMHPRMMMRTGGQDSHEAKTAKDGDVNPVKLMSRMTMHGRRIARTGSG